MRPALVLMSLCFSLMGCVQAPAMTDEEVIAAWEKENDATVDNKRHFGIERPETFKNVICCATFAHDYGMHDSGMFVGTKYTDSVNGCQLVMESASWKDADKAAREKLAQAYVTEIFCAWRGYMSEAGDAFDDVDNKFTKLETKTVDGNQVVTFWQAGVVGMRPERSYYKIEVTIKSDGNMGDRKTLEQFTVSFR